MKNSEKKSLAKFTDSALNLNEMKKVQGGGRDCPARQPWQYGCPELL